MHLFCKSTINDKLWVPALHLLRYQIVNPSSTYCKNSFGIIKYTQIGIWGSLCTFDREQTKKSWNVVQILWKDHKLETTRLFCSFLINFCVGTIMSKNWIVWWLTLRKLTISLGRQNSCPWNHTCIYISPLISYQKDFKAE